MASEPFFSLHFEANSKKSIFMMQKGFSFKILHLFDLSKRNMTFGSVEVGLKKHNIIQLCRARFAICYNFHNEALNV